MHEARLSSDWGSWGALARAYLVYLLIVTAALIVSLGIGSWFEDRQIALLVELGILALVAVVTPCVLVLRVKGLSEGNAGRRE